MLDLGFKIGRRDGKKWSKGSLGSRGSHVESLVLVMKAQQAIITGVLNTRQSPQDETNQLSANLGIT